MPPILMIAIGLGVRLSVMQNEEIADLMCGGDMDLQVLGKRKTAYFLILSDQDNTMKEFEKLRTEAGLPNVVFHSLRHSSTTYKLKLNHGDLKATQGDTGHAQIDMITSIYAHILDEDRKINAQKFECAFYSNPDLRNVKPPKEQEQSQTVDLAALIEQLQKSPELANTLAALKKKKKTS